MTEGGGRPLRVAVVGTGVQGRKHVGKLAGGLDGCELAGIHDIRPELAESVAGEFATRAFRDLDEVVGAADAAVVAVPTQLHLEVARRLLSFGVHVLVEKPMAPSLAEADALLEAARRAERVLAVGHSEYFNPAARALLDVGIEPGFVEAHRLAEFKPRSLDIDVILDLMIHDLQVLHALDASEVVEVRASGINVLTARIDIANVRIELASGCVANLTASRVSQEGVRKLRVFSRAGAYYSLDYAARTVSGVVLEQREGRRAIARERLEVPRLDALEEELTSFFDACRGLPARYVDGGAGRQALKTALEIIERMGSVRSEER